MTDSEERITYLEDMAVNNTTESSHEYIIHALCEIARQLSHIGNHLANLITLIENPRPDQHKEEKP